MGSERAAPVALLATLATLAACAGEPITVEVTTTEDVGVVAALDLTLIEGDTSRCQRFPVPSFPSRIAVVDELAEGLDGVLVTAVDALGTPLASGTAPLADDVLVTLAPLERRLPRGNLVDAGLADSVGRGGGQLARTAAGAVTAIWIDPGSDLPVRARRIDLPSLDLPDQPVNDLRDTGGYFAVIAGLDDRYVAAWVEGGIGVVTRALDAPAPLPSRMSTVRRISDDAPDRLPADPSLAVSGQRVLATWVNNDGSLIGPINARWLDKYGAPAGPVMTIGDPGGLHRLPRAVAVTGGAVIAAIDGGSFGAIQLVRVSDSGEVGPISYLPEVTRGEALAMAPAPGGLALAYAEDTYDGQRVRIVILDEALAVRAGPVELGGELDGDEVALTALPGGGYVVGWHEAGGAGALWLRWLDDQGRPVGPARRAAAGSGDQAHPSLVALDDDRVAVAWDQAGTPEHPAAITGRIVSRSVVPPAPRTCP